MDKKIKSRNVFSIISVVRRCQRQDSWHHATYYEIFTWFSARFLKKSEMAGEAGRRVGGVKSLLKQSSNANGGNGGGDDAGEISLKLLSGLLDGVLRPFLLFFSAMLPISTVVFLFFRGNLALSSRVLTDCCFLSTRRTCRLLQ